jgi:hypothetical protein
MARGAQGSETTSVAELWGRLAGFSLSVTWKCANNAAEQELVRKNGMQIPGALGYAFPASGAQVIDRGFKAGVEMAVKDYSGSTKPPQKLCLLARDDVNEVLSFPQLYDDGIRVFPRLK